MLRFLLTYLVIAYFVSGCVCYLVFIKHQYQDNSHNKLQPMLLINIWIVVLWPIWIIKEIFVNKSQTENQSNNNKAANKSTVNNLDIKYQTKS